MLRAACSAPSTFIAELERSAELEMKKSVVITFFGIATTGLTYLVDMGCSCGSARGIPFSYIHPFAGCSSGKYVIRMKSEGLFDPVFDYASAAGNIVFWCLAAYAAMRFFTNKKDIESEP